MSGPRCSFHLTLLGLHQFCRHIFQMSHCSLDNSKTGPSETPAGGEVDESLAVLRLPDSWAPHTAGS